MRVPLAQANLLAAYRDFPKSWRLRVLPSGFELHDDGVEVRFLLGRSPATMSIEVRRGEPFVRVSCAVDWKTSPQRLGSKTGLRSQAMRCGTAWIGALPRYSDDRAGLALFAIDPLRWTSRALRKGGMHLRTYHCSTTAVRRSSRGPLRRLSLASRYGALERPGSISLANLACVFLQATIRRS